MAGKTHDEFVAYCEENPELYELFKLLAFAKISEGAGKCSAYYVMNGIRWGTPITGPARKIDHGFMPRYARKFMHDYPEHKGLFDIVLLAEEKVAPKRITGKPARKPKKGEHRNRRLFG